MGIEAVDGHPDCRDLSKLRGKRDEWRHPWKAVGSIESLNDRKIKLVFNEKRDGEDEDVGTYDDVGISFASGTRWIRLGSIRWATKTGRSREVLWEQPCLRTVLYE